jgi:hypothetical protein
MHPPKDVCSAAEPGKGAIATSVAFNKEDIPVMAGCVFVCKKLLARWRSLVFSMGLIGRRNGWRGATLGLWCFGIGICLRQSGRHSSRLRRYEWGTPGEMPRFFAALRMTSGGWYEAWWRHKCRSRSTSLRAGSSTPLRFAQDDNFEVRGSDGAQSSVSVSLRAGGCGRRRWIRG